jgi:hypothetical protein
MQTNIADVDTVAVAVVTNAKHEISSCFYRMRLRCLISFLLCLFILFAILYADVKCEIQSPIPVKQYPEVD